MADYLLDCNHLSAALHKVSPLRDRIHQFHRLGHRFITHYPVMCELETGIQQTAKPEEYRRRLDRLLLVVRIWLLDVGTSRIYGKTSIELRRLGRVLSQVDVMVAAMARQHNLIVLSTDGDFEAVAGLKVENWIV